MLLSISPDIDIVLGLVGIDLDHRTFTHSIIIWLVIGGTIIFLISLKLKSRGGSEAAIYLIAYMSHLMIGDIIVEYINILYPIGDFTINSTIRSGSLKHISIEAILIGLMAAVVITKFKGRKKESSLFIYHGITDSFLYVVLVLAIAVSAIYILNEFQLSLVHVLILVMLHSGAIAIIILLWVESKCTQRRQQHLASNP
jgi:membrane-bound metal-dependent hydrolase YbcI (DUF457 family)